MLKKENLQPGILHVILMPESPTLRSGLTTAKMSTPPSNLPICGDVVAVVLKLGLAWGLSKPKFNLGDLVL